MIITGQSTSFNLDLLTRLLDDVSDNTRVEPLHFRHVVLEDVEHALRHMQALTAGTMGWKGIYHAKIRPAPKYSLTRDQWLHAADVLEQELGFDDQPRVVILHEKGDAAHIHALWARTDLDTLTLLSDAFTYGKHERAARALEAAFGHEVVPSWRDPGPPAPNRRAGPDQPDRGR